MYLITNTFLLRDLFSVKKERKSGFKRHAKVYKSNLVWLLLVFSVLLFCTMDTVPNFPCHCTWVNGFVHASKPFVSNINHLFAVGVQLDVDRCNYSNVTLVFGYLGKPSLILLMTSTCKFLFIIVKKVNEKVALCDIYLNNK